MGYGAHGACQSRCRWGTLGPRRCRRGTSGPRRWPGALSHARSGQVRFHTPGRLLSETSSSSWRRRPRGGAGAAPSAGVSMSPHPDFLAPPTGTLCHRTTKRARRQSGARAWWRLGGATHRFLVLILLRLPAPRGANSFLLPHGAIEVVRLHRGRRGVAAVGQRCQLSAGPRHVFTPQLSPRFSPRCLAILPGRSAVKLRG